MRVVKNVFLDTQKFIQCKCFLLAGGHCYRHLHESGSLHIFLCVSFGPHQCHSIIVHTLLYPTFFT